MVEETYDANYGGRATIDVCHACNGMWFDGKESLQLTPGATLQLFRSAHARTARPMAQDGSHRCPRCAAPLVTVHDQVKGTRYTSDRCDEHGRFETFFQFLREKALVRQPTAQELQKLRDSVKQIACSNCGAPISIATESTCTHCRAPVCILGGEKLEATLARLQEAEARRTTVDPTVAARLIMDKLDVNAMWRREHPEETPMGTLGAGAPGPGWGRTWVGADGRYNGGDLLDLVMSGVGTVLSVFKK